ncbi:hypothetical protein GDO86_009739 [Hymenochirus boettgeri]|nr:hypothetical protein GDO86_009739 [Hymenochirus boettgeri]KAG8444683.1 hypothetical protein GDO86_009739 [Hymenochirus boettgeri]
MRIMVDNAEMQKHTILEQQTMEQKINKQDSLEVHSKLTKLELLEKECLRLTTTQRTAENKIHQLQEKLKTEEQHRRSLQEKASQLKIAEIIKIQTGVNENRTLASISKNVPQTKVKKKKQQKQKIILTKDLPSKSFYPKARELPFVAGKSTSLSHSLSANIQSALHMMKHHSPRNTQKNTKTEEQKCLDLPGKGIPTCAKASFSGDTLTDLLLALQDELGQMSVEHQELLQEINETKNTVMKEDLECELDCLVKQMEIKSDQILKLKSHQVNVAKLKKKANTVTKSKNASATKLATNEQTLNATAPKTPKQQGHLSNGICTPKYRASLDLLKDVQKIQMSLKKDDIMWEK